MMRFAEAVQAAKAEGGIVSPTYFRDGISPGAYSISSVDEWRFTYKDHPPTRWYVTITNRLTPGWTFGKHLVLYDATGTSRFALAYERRGRSNENPDKIFLYMYALQRMRTCYRRQLGIFLRWDAKAETHASKEFQESLAGMHPAEFLMAEFLYRNRDFLRPRLLRGDCALSTPSYQGMLHLEPILERYFTPHQKRPGPREDLSLNPQKQRVRVILGLDDLARESVPEIALPEDVARVTHG